jgi:hypothetical protein
MNKNTFFSIVIIITSMLGVGETIGLAALASVINDRTHKTVSRYQNDKSKKEKLNTRNIYATNNSRAVRDDFEDKARARYKESRDFKNTKVIPRHYKALDEFNKKNMTINANKVAKIEDFSNEDNDSTFSDDEKTFDSHDGFDNKSTCSNESDDGYRGFNDPASMLDKMGELTNNRKFESCVAKDNSVAKNRDKFKEKNTWMNQHNLMAFDNPEGFVASNASNKNTIGDKSGIARIELERQMELDGGYSAFDKHDDGTYGIIKPNSPDFIHENMIPFVRKGPNPFNETKRNMVNQMNLELFTGSTNDPMWRPKIERAPLFSPLIGAKNIYGDPVRTDEYTSRYFPGDEKRNELPFQQVKVTPGLNIGYNAVGKHGYHDMYRVIPTEAYVDNLRTLDNPKITYGSYVGPGQKGEKGPVLGKVSQYKAPRYRERGTKDMVRTRSYITAPTVYGEYDPKSLATVNRGVEATPAIGPAKHFLEGNTPGKYIGEHSGSRKENYLYDHPRNVILYESFSGQGHNNESFLPDPTQRNVNDLYDRMGHVTGERKQITAVNWSDVADATKRDIQNKYDRSGHVTGEKKQITAVNWGDVADPTRRNIQDKYDRQGHLTGERNQITAINWGDVADPTRRNIQDQYDRAGHVTGEKEQITAINWNDVNDPTRRNIQDKYDRAGHLTGERNQITAVNWNDVADPTRRNIKDKYDRAGHVTGEKNQITAINWNDVADPTRRNIKDKYDRAGHITGEKNQITAINWNDVADPTRRNIKDKYDRAGHITGERNQITAINWNDVLDPTRRNIKDKYDRAGHITGEKNQITAVNWNDVADPTRRNIHDKYDRSGHVTGEKEQITAVNWSDVADPTRRNIHDKYDRSGHLTGEKNQITAINWNDVMDPTRRNIQDKYDRAGHITGEKNQITAVNWNDVSDPTRRNIHDKYDRTGHITGEKEQMLAINWNDVADPTRRNIQDKYDRAGHITGEKNQITAINWNDVSDPTRRNIHDKYDRTGHMTGEKEQILAINWNDVADPTRRDIHDKYDRYGHITGEKEQMLAINWNDVADPTKRNIQDKYDRMGHITGEREPITAINWNDVADPTKRNIHDQYDRYGHVTGEKKEIIAINWDDVPDPTGRQINPGGRSGMVYDSRQGIAAINWDDIPDPTNREMHPGGRHGPADSQDRRQGSRHEYMVMNVNGAKEALEEGRAPTAVAQNKGWTIDYTGFRYRCPVETKWKPGPNSDIMYVNDKYRSANTNIPVNKFYINDRILGFTEENLQGNPLVSNVLHRSVDIKA